MAEIAQFLAIFVQIFIYGLILQGFLSFLPKNNNSFLSFLNAFCGWYLNFFVRKRKSLLATNFFFILSFVPLIILKSVLVQLSLNQSITLNFVLILTLKTLWYNLFLWFIAFFIIILIIYLFNPNNYIISNMCEKIFARTYLIFYKKKNASDKKLAITALISLLIIAISLTYAVNYIIKLL